MLAKFAPRIFFIMKSLEFSLVLRILRMRKAAKRCKQKFLTNFACKKTIKKPDFMHF